MKIPILILALLPSFAFGGEFKKIRDGLYEFSGPMYMSDVAEFKRIAGKETQFELVIDSPGGSLDAGIQLADFTKSISNKVRITAKECYSAAALWTVADDDWRWCDDKSFVAFHLPWYPAHTPTEADWMYCGYLIGSCLDRMLGHAVTDPLMFRLALIRDKHNINGFEVWFKDSKKSGLWTSDGWVWDDKSPTLRTRLTPMFTRP